MSEKGISSIIIVLGIIIVLVLILASGNFTNVGITTTTTTSLSLPPNATVVVLTVGQRLDTFLVQKINFDSVDGLFYAR